MKKYNLSVVDFARPSPKVGSIDTYSGFGFATERGIRIHQKFQSKLSSENSTYCPEIHISHTFTFKRTLFQISGRMDGIYRGDSIRIEEIKTAFDLKKFIKELEGSELTHPYWLQLQTYGYIHWLQTQTIPELNLLLVSTRNKKSQSISLELKVQQFENYLERRFNELILEIKDLKIRINSRKKASLQLDFPFKVPRSNQKELIDYVKTVMVETKPILIQAPTGLGKTMGILFPKLFFAHN